MERTSDVVEGESSTQGPVGITWCVWTSKMNSEPVSACWQAAVSSGGGTLNRPPLPRARRCLRVRGRRRGAAGELEHGERRRDGPGALQEAPAVHPDPACRVVDGRPDQRVDLAVPGRCGRRDELAVGDGPGAEAGAGRRDGRAADGRKGRCQPCREDTPGVGRGEGRGSGRFRPRFERSSWTGEWTGPRPRPFAASRLQKACATPPIRRTACPHQAG